MKKKKVDIVTISFFVITLLIAAISFFMADMEKVFKALLLLVVIIITKFLFTKTFLKKSKVGYYGFLFFEFISIFLANLFGFYGISYYDKLLHFISGIFLAILGLIVYVGIRNKANVESSSYKKDKIFLLFPLFFSIAMAGVWEIWEFSTDNLFGLNAQNNSLTDTMTDIICGTIGAIIMATIIYLWQNGKKIKIVEKIIIDSKF